LKSEHNSNGGKADRPNFLQEYEYVSAQTPGPGQYYPRVSLAFFVINLTENNPENEAYAIKTWGLDQKTQEGKTR